MPTPAPVRPGKVHRVAASAQGAEYTWQDGPTTRRMLLQIDLVAQPTSENRADDVVAADQGELSIVRKQERHEQGRRRSRLPDRVRPPG